MFLKLSLNFFRKYEPAPVGFAAFDLDYYNSTKDALRLFEARQEFFLPRVECYFDDVNSFEILFSASSHTGVLLAIIEFNQNSETKMLKKENLAAFRHFKQGWNEQYYVHHNFKHPKYNEFIAKSYVNQLNLT